MAALVVREGIRAETGSVLSFGDFSVKEKIKVNDYEHGGDLYNLRSHTEITRIEKNGSLLLEAVPGASCFYFRQSAEQTAFSAAGQGVTQITMELEPSVQYALTIGGAEPKPVKSSASGKVSFSAELYRTQATDIKLELDDVQS